MSEQHQPVLLAEAITYLAIEPAGTYIDATFGRGGHSRAILSNLNGQGKLFALDRDATAIAAAKEQAVFADPRFVIRQGAFGKIADLLASEHLTHGVNGILVDLGVSSPQLDEAQRGFSFMRDGPLDMRMDTGQTLDAATWINSVKEQELAKILKTYGEERFAKRIARAIANERTVQPFTHTTQLAATIAKAHPAWEKYKHPATRSFQAIRIFINDELAELQTLLAQCLELLKVGGRLLVITFHSLEEQIVKKFMRQHIQASHIPRGLPIQHVDLPIRLKKINGAIRPTLAELDQNPRARSATLRVMEKIQ